MTDRDGIKAFEAWLKVYWANQAAPFLDVDDLREAWVQGVAWGRKNPVDTDVTSKG